MKKFFASTIILLLLASSLSGCGNVGAKSASLTIIYGAAAVLALLLMVGYCLLVRKRNVWFIVMFAAISVVNIGYFCLAVSSSLSEALLANRIAYLGQVVLPAAMLMIILNVSNISFPKWLPYCLLSLSAVMLFIAGSPGYLDIYYKEVSFEIVNGVATLEKVYGPLHPLYLVYLVGYFGVMIGAIIRSWIKKTVDSTAHAIIVAIAVFVNIGVWFIEQLVSIEFEFLSVSYIISELFLLGAHQLMNENQRLKEMVQQKEVHPIQLENEQIHDVGVQADVAELFIKGYDGLTAKELELFNAYIAGMTTKDIMQAMAITENTLKYHSRNLYGKLCVSSRKELVALYHRLRASGYTID